MAQGHGRGRNGTGMAPESPVPKPHGDLPPRREREKPPEIRRMEEEGGGSAPFRGRAGALNKPRKVFPIGGRVRILRA